MSNDPPDGMATRTLRQGDLPIARKLRSTRLRITSHDGRSWDHEVSKPRLRVGSHEDNELVLTDPAVSRLHFEIRADEHGFRLRDLESRNGTFVDGLRALDVYLRDGATIRAGGTSVRFELLAEETDLPLSADDRFEELVGRSVAMRELFGLLERVAPSDATVLIAGENGTGKELVARAIHKRSARAGGPYMVFDCAAVASNLLESELFGHEKGAFTGASAERVGVMEEADGGTLFLDEIGELPLELQPKLLRAIQEREVRRVGASRSRPVDVRLVAATNRDLAAEINRGAFRTDLYYRLAVVEVGVPPLRERLEDLPLLVRHLATEATGDPARAEVLAQGLASDGWARLRAHPWPGNVRELRNVVRRSAILGPTDEALPDASRSQPSAPTSGASLDLAQPMMAQKKALVAWFEEAYLTGILDAHDGNFTHAAAAAGVERMYFKRLLRKYRPR